MRIDLYTRVILTIIAACLVWLSIGGPSLMTPLQAQIESKPSHVFIAGWVDEKGTTRTMPSFPSGGNLPVWVANR